MLNIYRHVRAKNGTRFSIYQLTRILNNKYSSGNDGQQRQTQTNRKKGTEKRTNGTTEQRNGQRQTDVTDKHTHMYTFRKRERESEEETNRNNTHANRDRQTVVWLILSRAGGFTQNEDTEREREGQIGNPADRQTDSDPGGCFHTKQRY